MEHSHYEMQKDLRTISVSTSNQHKLLISEIHENEVGIDSCLPSVLLHLGHLPASLSAGGYDWHDVKSASKARND